MNKTEGDRKGEDRNNEGEDVREKGRIERKGEDRNNEGEDVRDYVVNLL